MITLINTLHPNNLLNNKIIAISGASSGIGKTIAKAFAAHGASIILLGRTVAKFFRNCLR